MARALRLEADPRLREELFNRKERKERRGKGQQWAGWRLSGARAQGEFADFEFVRAEVDQEAVLQARGLQLTQNLRFVVVRQGFDRFQIYDEFTLHQQVGKVIANERAILIIDLDGMLLFDIQARLAETVCQGVLVHLFQMPVPMVNVNVVGRLPHLVAQRLDVLHTGFGLFDRKGRREKQPPLSSSLSLSSLCALRLKN